MDDFDPRRASVDLVTAFVNNNALSAGELPALLRDVFSAIPNLEAKVAPLAHGTEPTPAAVEHLVEAAPTREDRGARPSALKDSRARMPAVSVSESLADPTVIVSLITGERFKTLKRHLTKHGLTEAEYKAQFNLPDDYPTVAPAYAEVRRKIAAARKVGSKPAKAAAAAEADSSAEVQQPASKALKAGTSSLSAKSASEVVPAQEHRRRRARNPASPVEVAQPNSTIAADDAARKPSTDPAPTGAGPKPLAKRSAAPSQERAPNASPVKPRKKRRMARPAVADAGTETVVAAVPH